MKDALKRIVENFHKYNSEHMATQAFGLSEDHSRWKKERI